MLHVTQITKPYGTDFSHVKDLEYYQERGQKIHAICAAHAKGEWCPWSSDNRGQQQGIGGYVDSFRRWFELVDKVLLTEEYLESSLWGFCGKVDIVCTLKNDDRLVVPDYKSPLAYHRSWDLQTAGYKILVDEWLAKYKCNDIGLAVVSKYNQVPAAMRWGSLRLREDGGVAIFNEARPESVRAFLGALEAQKYMEGG
jgi:hypothetical protein